ncbi:MAG: ECF-type sigma factor [Thermoguttaceae bacterium]|jgi:DNA-directed RNA polymerase specialized sigma24 family protein
MVPSHDKVEKASALSADTSVTQWIAGLKAGEAKAADRLWYRYFDRLVRLARRKIGSAPRRAADEEDVAVIVFRNLWQGAEAGRFPELRNRENLWPLLVVLTSRAVHELLRAEKRRSNDDAPEDLNHIIAKEPTPDFAAMITENLLRLFAVLDPVQKQIAQGKLEGRENTEIARQVGCGLRTVERKLNLIRQIWDRNP